MSLGVRGFRRAVVIAVMAVIGLAWQLTVSAPVRASVLGGVFDSVVIAEDTAGPIEHMTVDTAFTIPSGSHAGDTFTLSLADPFGWVNDSFDIVDPITGEPVAHVVVSGSVATFTLTSYVEGKGPIHGTATFYTYFKGGSVQEGDIVTAHFTTTDETFTDTVVVGPQPVNSKIPRKVFYWIDRATQDGFSFAIYAGTLDQVPDAGRTVTITDIPSTGVKVDCTTILMQMAPDVGGTPGTWSRIPVRDRTLTCPAATSPNGFVAELRNIPADSYVRVRGKAIVTDPTLTTYTNIADVQIYGQTPIRVKNSVRRFTGSGQATGTPTTTTSTTSTTSTSSTTSTTSTSSTSSTTSTTSTTSTSSTSSTTSTTSTTTPPSSTTTTTTTPPSSTTTTTTTTPPSSTTSSTTTTEPASTTTTLPDTGAGRTTSIGGLGGALVLLGTVLVFASARRSRASGRYLAR